MITSTTTTPGMREPGIQDGGETVTPGLIVGAAGVPAVVTTSATGKVGAAVVVVAVTFGI